ncbi:MAG: carbohydrate kinase family protein [Clostridiales bacterium]|jgi:hypothetical protein|nr:carbohydrate kinase family protein [Clostridiales bacterium]
MSVLSELKRALETQKGFHLKMVIGVDGFVDEILHIVDKRHDVNRFTRVETIAALGERVSRASGLGTNIELVTVQTKLGGNGPIFANALIEYGVRLTYFGSIGKPEIHPVFKPMAEKAEAVYSICNPALTDALEFSDGKLMLGKHYALREITWENCLKVMGGAENIARLAEGCDLFGMENWTMVPNMSSLWEGMIRDVFPLMKAGGEKGLAFFDLADPEKRTKDDIRHAMELISRFGEKFRPILGLNEKELYEIAEVLGVSVNGAASPEEKLRGAVVDTYKKLNIYCLVVHPTKEAACCVNGEYFRVDGPFCAKPVLTTGAGDNFNAGFCLGQALGLDPASALTLGVSTSGFYVRNGKSPTYEDVINFVGQWDEGKLA